MNDEKQEFIDEAPTTSSEEKRPPSIIEFLQHELRQHMEIALDYKKKVDEAKTDHKKKYYRKKLIKNNEQAAKVLTALERVTAARKSKEVKEDDQETGHE